MKRAIFALALLVPVSASAQWDTHWNASGPHPDSCVFNGIQFYAGDTICVRPGINQVCKLDGTLGPPAIDKSCSTAQDPARSVVRAFGRHDTACRFGNQAFSVGAEICSASGAKTVCQDNGALGAPVHETTCPATLQTQN